MPSDAPPKAANPYRGRFAPSPTGPLHFGSLVAAVGSFLDARHRGGTWLVRMEDLDRTREVPGAANRILNTLDAFGLHWDGGILYQSRRTEVYAAALENLRTQGMTYPCGCSRKDIAALGRRGPEGPIYPGTCHSGVPSGSRARSERLRVPTGVLAFHDRVQGQCEQDIATDIGDFILRRADGFYAYQLAVVVDDAGQAITDVIRGADLCLSTPRQILLQGLLGLPTPAYGHLPLVLDDLGRKLSKSEAATPVDPADPIPALQLALRFLGQKTQVERPSRVAELLRQAITDWNLSCVPARASRPRDSAT